MTTSIDVNRSIITADELRRKVEAGGDVVILEVWRDGRHCGAQRIPGAHAMSLTADLTATPTTSSGNLPLPTEDQIQAAVQRWGINADSVVVAYSTENLALAARAWWTLKWAGVPDVRVLDGATPDWSHGHPRDRK